MSVKFIHWRLSWRLPWGPIVHFLGADIWAPGPNSSGPNYPGPNLPRHWIHLIHQSGEEWKLNKLAKVKRSLDHFFFQNFNLYEPQECWTWVGFAPSHTSGESEVCVGCRILKWISTFASGFVRRQICVDRNTNPKRPHQCILFRIFWQNYLFVWLFGLVQKTHTRKNFNFCLNPNVWICCLSSTSPTCWEAPFVLTDFPDVFFIFVNLIFVMKHSRQLTNTETKMWK